jgi:hypothetical protein
MFLYLVPPLNATYFIRYSISSDEPFIQDAVRSPFRIILKVQQGHF